MVVKPSFGGPGAYLIGEEEKQEILDVLESGYLFRYGAEDDPNFKKKVYTLEKEFAQFIGVKYAVAVNSGTSALLCTLAALGIGPGDEVLVPGYTFIASISSIIMMRAIPVLCEVDESLTIDPKDVERKITDKTKAIMAVHMLGNPCDMEAIMDIARKHNLAVIEDCAQATGGSYRGKRLGSIGNIGAFSLNIFKMITAGDGGMVATDDYDLYERAFAFHDQGHKPLRMGVEVGQRSIVGLDFRMNELTGAVALAQLRKIDRILAALREKKRKLKNLLTGLSGFTFHRINDEDGECATLLTLIFESKEKAEAFAAKIGTKPLAYSGWHVYNNMEQILGKKTYTAYPCPYECPAYGKKIEYHAHMLPQTDDLLSRSVNISVGVVDKGLGSPFGITITSSDEEIGQVAETIRKHVVTLRG
ncbi:MAG: DegT/DnrJ/EryC1/StrS family aminotransferase [Candidatus Atribacteria bacterium]|nr:DegT/DnrJ/EryC1/StrS family aminotransferase [Candidatus Atribacteria bacterium]